MNELTAPEIKLLEVNVQLLELKDKLEALLADDSNDFDMRDKYNLHSALHSIKEALNIPLPDGYMSCGELDDALRQGRPHTNHIDAGIELEDCKVCGHDMYYIGRRDELTYYSYHRCGVCGCGYSF